MTNKRIKNSTEKHLSRMKDRGMRRARQAWISWQRSAGCRHMQPVPLGDQIVLRSENRTDPGAIRGWGSGDEAEGSDGEK
uniref:DUF5641 domain-containing protein n=1 Tax=Steinernema glaseri TaxID=37863 RepID=A0A1I7XZW1_9BILA